jgi:hypothetical protein
MKTFHSHQYFCLNMFFTFKAAFLRTRGSSTVSSSRAFGLFAGSRSNSSNSRSVLIWLCCALLFDWFFVLHWNGMEGRQEDADSAALKADLVLMEVEKRLEASEVTFL